MTLNFKRNSISEKIENVREMKKEEAKQKIRLYYFL